MAVILERTKSTYGNPYAYYKLETTSVSDRTANSVKVTYKITSSLASAGSYLGTGYSLDARIYTNGSWSDYISVKPSSAEWSGTTEHTKTITLTTTGISSSATKLTKVYFQVVSSSGDKACQLNTTSCKDITIPIGHQAPDIGNIQVVENVTYLKNTIGIDNEDFINGASIKTFTLTGTTYDNATITSFKIQNGSYSETTTNITNNSGSITLDFQTHPLAITEPEYVQPGVYNTIDFTITATDNLGGVGKTTLSYDITPLTYSEYTKPTATATSLKAKRDGQLTGKVKLNANGTYISRVGVLEAYHDQIPTLTLNVYESDDTTLKFTRTITTSDSEFVASDGTWTLTDLQIGSTNEQDTNWFNPANIYVIKIIVHDDLTNNITTLIPLEYSTQVLQGEPTWSEYKDRVDFKKITINKQDMIISDTFVETISSIASGGTKTLTYNISKAGYKPIAISGYAVGNSAINVYGVLLVSDTEASMSVRNIYTATSTNINCRIYVIYIKA